MWNCSFLKRHENNSIFIMKITLIFIISQCEIVHFQKGMKNLILLLMDFCTPSFAWNLMSGFPISVVLILPDLVLARTFFKKFFLISLTNSESESEPDRNRNNNLMMRQTGLSTSQVPHIQVDRRQERRESRRSLRRCENVDLVVELECLHPPSLGDHLSYENFFCLCLCWP